MDSHIDNMLKVTSDGKKLALDPRCFVPTCKDEEGSKLNACAQNIYEIWSDTSDIKGTQIVFCDLSTPKSRFEDYVYGTDFDAYNDLKYKLVQKGIHISVIELEIGVPVANTTPRSLPWSSCKYSHLSFKSLALWLAALEIPATLFIFVNRNRFL